MKKDNPQPSLFGPVRGDWIPPSDLPKIKSAGIRRVWVDAETDGNDKKKSKPVGLAVALPYGKWYLPFGHRNGGNIDEGSIKRWAKDELRDCVVSNINTGFDSEVILNWGVDLEAQGCMLHDVAHSAALINNKRYKGVNLNELGMEVVGRGKAPCPVAPQDIHKAHSSLIGPYAEEDAALAMDVDNKHRPIIEAERLDRVELLEDALIWANNHMERNGIPLDMPKLEDWIHSLDDEQSELTIKIWAETGVKLRPNIVGDWGKLFDARGIDRNKTGEWKTKANGDEDAVESYTGEFLEGVQDDYIKMGLTLRRIASLRSKYLDKYHRAQRNGILPFNLYQLRATEEDYGTVVGRYSSARVNIQQVFKVTNQWEKWCTCGCAVKKRDKLENHRADCFGIRYVVRELMVPGPGMHMFAVDGSQLQFRLFAHYSNDPTLIAAYRDNPDVDFHQLVADLFNMLRQAAKHNNFAMVLGMGREKLAVRSGHACTCKPTEWWSKAVRSQCSRQEAQKHIFGINSNHASACPARESNDMADRYGKQFPAAEKLMKKITKLAEDRGWIRSLLGRLLRYLPGDKFYSAFAGLLQSSEADMVKSKILTLYRNRHDFGLLRFPVHDEIVGDIMPDPKYKKWFEELCRVEELPLKVPMIWNAGYGLNWKDTK